jgi:hypothetical protein
VGFAYKGLWKNIIGQRIWIIFKYGYGAGTRIIKTILQNLSIM